MKLSNRNLQDPGAHETLASSCHLLLLLSRSSSLFLSLRSRSPVDRQSKPCSHTGCGRGWPPKPAGFTPPARGDAGSLAAGPTG
ncbi:hypothetical protein BHM03_00034077 [Ensete ventricosum]|nr:hypothetical protein BHM03_00034077 [Ensete ventricosum]